MGKKEKKKAERSKEEKKEGGKESDDAKSKKDAEDKEAARKREEEDRRKQEMKNEYDKGFKAGEKSLDQWKDKNMDLNTAIAHAKREAPHTSHEEAGKKGEVKGA